MCALLTVTFSCLQVQQWVYCESDNICACTLSHSADFEPFPCFYILHFQIPDSAKSVEMSIRHKKRKNESGAKRYKTVVAITASVIVKNIDKPSPIFKTF